MVIQQLIKNISWNALGKICVMAISLAISILTARYLGKERLGIYSSILVIPSFARLLNCLGLETVLNTKLPEFHVKDESGGKERFLLKKIIGLRILSTAIFCGLLYFFLPVYLGWIHMGELISYRLPILAYFVVTTILSIQGIIFMAYLKYKVTSAMESSNSALNLLFLLVFAFWFDLGIEAILYAYICSTAVIIIAYFKLLSPYVSGESSKAEMDDGWNIAFVSYMAGIFSFGLLVNCDIVIMNYFMIPPENISYYYLATGMGAMLTFALAGIGPLALSLFSETFERQSYNGLSAAWRQILGFLIFCVTPVYLFAIIYARPLINIVYGEQFAQTEITLSIYLVFLFIATFFGASFSSSMLFVLKKRKIILRSAIEGSILNIILNIILIPIYQEVGAVIATGSIMVYMVLRQLHAIKEAIGVRDALLFNVKCFFLFIVAIIPSMLISELLINNIFLNGILYFFVSVIFLYWIKPLKQDHCRVILEISPKFDRLVRCFAQ